MFLATGRYWYRVFSRAVSATAWFTEEKLLAGLTVALLSLLAKWKLTMNSADIACDVLIVVGSYGIVMIVTFVGNLIKTPALLDGERQTEIRAAQSTISDLRTELARKRPIDVEREQEVQNWLADFSGEEKQLLKWLLHQGERGVNFLRRSGLPQAAIDGCISKGRRCGLINSRYDRNSSPVQSLESINPNYKDALENVFHPL